MAGDVAALVRTAACGDADAWNALVGRFARLIWAVARSHGLSVADADDVTQTTWLRLAEHLTRLRDPEHVGLWLAKTARNESLRTLRVAGRTVPFDPGDQVPAELSGRDVDTELLLRERDETLWQAFRRLSSPCKVLLLMLTWEPRLSYAEVSSTLGMPVGSIGPTRNRCLKCLRNTPEFRALIPQLDAETAGPGAG